MTIVFPKSGLTQRLKVGYLDPVNSKSGILQRLKNMGYVPDGSSDSESNLLHSALLAFQRAKNLSRTGELDEATRQQLAQIHGS